MGWTPKRTSGAGSSAGDGSASPTPPRRRRSAVVAAGTDDLPAAPVRPPGGVNNQAGYGRDDRPRDITVRLGKRWSEIVGNVKAGEYTWAEFVDGLDEEELARGQLKDKNGKFQGRPPTVVPREFLLACQREMKRRFDELFQSDVIPIAKEYLKMAQSKDLKPETKAKMLQYAMERVFGGIPKDVTIRQEQPWEQLVVNVMGSDDDRQIPPHLQERYERYEERKGGDNFEE